MSQPLRPCLAESPAARSGMAPICRHPGLRGLPRHFNNVSAQRRPDPVLRPQAMNTVTAVESDSGTLVEIIELKWLLAGEGFHVHVERLRTDRDYARQALTAPSRHPTRRCARRRHGCERGSVCPTAEAGRCDACRRRRRMQPQARMAGGRRRPAMKTAIEHLIAPAALRLARACASRPPLGPRPSCCRTSSSPRRARFIDADSVLR